MVAQPYRGIVLFDIVTQKISSLIVHTPMHSEKQVVRWWRNNMSLNGT